jgi:hypothetical protein
MTRPSRLPILLVASIAVLVAACAAPVLHRAEGVSYPAREPTCRFRVVGAHPGPGYEEVGTLTIEGDRSGGAGSYTDPQEFADVVRADVCKVGGDVLVTEVGSMGVIARGIVFHQVDAGAPAAEPTPPAPAAAGTCTPICSPGFACTAGTCIPQCNPACAAGETCGNDRLCHGDVH